MRIDFTKDTKRILSNQVNGICSFPLCNKSTLGSNDDVTKYTSIGEAAHIAAAAPGGPRFDNSLTTEEIKHFNNGIWLCQEHHTIIDRNPEEFTSDKLKKWKKDALEKARLDRPVISYNEEVLALLKEELVLYILSGRLDKAFRRLTDFYKEVKSYDQLLEISLQLQISFENFDFGAISLKDFIVQQHRITLKLIDFIGSLPEREISDSIYKFEISKDYKKLGNICTRMIAIRPYSKEYPLSFNSVRLEPKMDLVYDGKTYDYFYNSVKKELENRNTIYNEAKANLVGIDVKFNEEKECFFAELEIGVCGYIDFLAVNRNLDSDISISNVKTTIREDLTIDELFKDPMNPRNRTPKPLGINSILITSDQYVIFQRRQKSEVASNMYHVTIAEGLQLYKSYDKFIEMDEAERENLRGDRSLAQILRRAIKEELGIEKNEVIENELLSIYYDCELQQPIFQTSALLSLNRKEIFDYFNQNKGRDTMAEIDNLIFVPFGFKQILEHFYKLSQDGVWSTHATINIISFLERHFGEKENFVELINSVFKEKFISSLGRQLYSE